MPGGATGAAKVGAATDGTACCSDGGAGSLVAIGDAATLALAVSPSSLRSEAGELLEQPIMVGAAPGSMMRRSWFSSSAGDVMAESFTPRRRECLRWMFWRA